MGSLQESSETCSDIWLGDACTKNKVGEIAEGGEPGNVTIFMNVVKINSYRGEYIGGTA